MSGYRTELELLPENIPARIEFRVIPGGGDDWTEPKYPPQVEFLRVFAQDEAGGWEEIGLGRSPIGDQLFWAAEEYCRENQGELLELARDWDLANMMEREDGGL